MPGTDRRVAEPQPPPHAEEAEQAILGAILSDDKCLPFVQAILQPSDFYLPAHAAIYEAQVALQAAGSRVDAVTLAEALRSRGWYDKAGGAAYFDQLLDRVPVAAHVEEHAEIVAERSRQRLTINLADQIRAEAMAGASSSDLSGMLSRGSSMVLPRQRSRSPAEILRAEINGEPTRDVRFVGLAGTAEDGTAFDLGAMIGEVAPGQKIVIGGRTSDGKTALMRAFWLAAAQHGTAAAYLSLEDSEREIVAGGAAAVSHLATRPILGRRWSEWSRTEGERVAAWFDRLPLSVAYVSTPTIEEVVAAIRWQVAHHRARVVVVDYLQKIRGGSGSEGRVAYLGRALGAMSQAVRGEAVLVVGSQLRRPPTGTNAKTAEPSKHDLRDSGEIEEDAKAVLLLRRLGEDSDNGHGIPVRRSIAIEIAKNKLGQTGTVPATLWLRHTIMWPGSRRPIFDLSAGPSTEPEQPPDDTDDYVPAWVQEELRPSEAAEHEDAPF